uniref:Cell division protein n=1 Tax=Lobochlamys segnis TaxID=52035 RepID=A0A0S2IC09_9CHLO|nr:cell division protein [Lobochlamys segnis]
MNQFNKILNKEIIDLMRKNYNKIFFENSESLITRIDDNVSEIKPYNRIEGNKQTSSIFSTQNNFTALNKNGALDFNDQDLRAFVSAKIGLGDLGGNFANVKTLIPPDQKFLFNMNKAQRNSSFLNLTKNFLSKRLGNQTLFPLSATPDEASLLVDASISCISNATTASTIENATASPLFRSLLASSPQLLPSPSPEGLPASPASSQRETRAGEAALLKLGKPGLRRFPLLKPGKGRGQKLAGASKACEAASPSSASLERALPQLLPNIRTWLRPTQRLKKKPRDTSPSPYGLEAAEGKTDLIKKRSLLDDNKNNSDHSDDNDYFYYKLQSSQFEIIYLQLVKSNLEFSLFKGKGALAALALKQSAVVCPTPVQCSSFQLTAKAGTVPDYSGDLRQANSKHCDQSVPEKYSKTFLFQWTNMINELRLFRVFDHSQRNPKKYIFLQKSFQSQPPRLSSIEGTFFSPSPLESFERTSGIEPAANTAFVVSEQSSDTMVLSGQLPLVSVSFLKTSTFFKRWAFLRKEATNNNSGAIISTVAAVRQPREWKKRTDRGGHASDINVLKFAHRDAVLFYWLIPFFGFVLSGASKFNQLNSILSNLSGSNYEQNLFSTERQISFYESTQVDPKSKLYRARPSKPFFALPKDLQFGQKKQSLTIVSEDTELKVIENNNQLYGCDVDTSFVSSLRSDNNEILRNFFIRLKNKKEFNQAKMNWVWWVQRCWFSCSQPLTLSEAAFTVAKPSLSLSPAKAGEEVQPAGAAKAGSSPNYQSTKGLGARPQQLKVSPNSKLVLYGSGAASDGSLWSTAGTFDPMLKIKSFGFLKDFPSQMIKTKVSSGRVKNRKFYLFSSSCHSIMTFAEGEKKAKLSASHIISQNWINKPLHSSFNKIIYHQIRNSSDLHLINPIISKQKTKYLLNYFFQQLSWIKVIPPSPFTSVSELKTSVTSSGPLSSTIVSCGTEYVTRSSLVFSSPFGLPIMREGSVSTGFPPAVAQKGLIRPHLCFLHLKELGVSRAASNPGFSSPCGEGETLAALALAKVREAGEQSFVKPTSFSKGEQQLPGSLTSLLNLSNEKAKFHTLMMKKNPCNIVIELTKNLDQFYNLLLIQKGQVPYFKTSSFTSSATTSPFNLTKQLEFFQNSSNKMNFYLPEATVLQDSAVASLPRLGVRIGKKFEDYWSSVISREAASPARSEPFGLLTQGLLKPNPNLYGEGEKLSWGDEQPSPQGLWLSPASSLTQRAANARETRASPEGLEEVQTGLGRASTPSKRRSLILNQFGQNFLKFGKEEQKIKPLNKNYILKNKKINSQFNKILLSKGCFAPKTNQSWKLGGEDQLMPLSELFLRKKRIGQVKPATLLFPMMRRIGKARLWKDSQEVAFRRPRSLAGRSDQSKTFYQCAQKQIDKMKSYSSIYPLALNQYVQFITNLTQKNSSSFWPAFIFRETKSCIALPSKSLKLKPRFQAIIKLNLRHRPILVPTLAPFAEQNMRLSTQSYQIEKLFRGYLNFGISNPLEASLIKRSQEAFSNRQLFQTTHQDRIINSQSTNVDKRIATIEKIAKKGNGQTDDTKKLTSKEQLIRSQRRLDGFRLLLTNQKFFLRKSISQYGPSLDQLRSTKYLTPVNRISLNGQNKENSNKSVFFRKFTFPSINNLDNNMVMITNLLYDSLANKHFIDASAPGKQELGEDLLHLTLAKEFQNVKAKNKRLDLSSIHNRSTSRAPAGSSAEYETASYKKNPDLIHRYSLKKDQQKKRRAKKQNLKTRWAKKRKRFYPRPSWLRFRMYLRWLVTKTSFNSDPGHFLDQRSFEPPSPQGLWLSPAKAGEEVQPGLWKHGKRSWGRTDIEKDSFLLPMLSSANQKGQNRVLNETINYNLSNSVINDLYNIKKNKQNYLKTYFKRIRSTLNKIRQISNNIHSTTKRFYIGRSKSIFSDFFTLTQNKDLAKFIPSSSIGRPSAPQNLPKLIEQQERIDSKALFSIPKAVFGFQNLSNSQKSLQTSSKLDKKFMQKKNTFLSEYNRIIYLRLQNIIHRAAMDKIFDYSPAPDTEHLVTSVRQKTAGFFIPKPQQLDKNQTLSKLNTQDNFSDLNEAVKIQNVGHRKLSSFLIEYSKRSSLLPQNADENKKKRKIKTFLQETWIWLYNLGYGKTSLGAALSFEDSSSFGLDFFKIPNNIKNISIVWALNKTNNLNNSSSQSFGGQHSRVDPQINYLWALQKLRNKSKNNKTKYLQKQFLNFFDSFLSKKQGFYFSRTSAGSLSHKKLFETKGANNNIFSQDRNAGSPRTRAIKIDGSFVLLKERALPTVPMPLLSEKFDAESVQSTQHTLPDSNASLNETVGLDFGAEKLKSIQLISPFMLKKSASFNNFITNKLQLPKNKSNFLIKSILQKSKRKEQKLFYLGERPESSFLSRFSTNGQFQIGPAYLTSLQSTKAEQNQRKDYSYLNNQPSNFEIEFRKRSIELNQNYLDEVVPSRPLRNNFHFWWTSTSRKPILNKQTVRFIYFIFHHQKSLAYISPVSEYQTASAFTIQNSITTKAHLYGEGSLYKSDFAKSTIICLFFHFCALISVISLFQLRSYLKFYFLVVFKLSTNLIYSLINFTDVLLSTFKKTFTGASKKESFNLNSRENSKTILTFKVNQRKIGVKNKNYLRSTNFFQQNQEKKNIAFFVRANTKRMYNKMQNYFSSSKFIFFSEIFRDQHNFDINYQQKNQVLNLLESRIRSFTYFLIFRPTFMSIFSSLFLIKKNDTFNLSLDQSNSESLHEDFVSQKNTRTENNSLKRLFDKLASVKILRNSHSSIPALPLVRQSLSIREQHLAAQRLPSPQLSFLDPHPKGLGLLTQGLLLTRKVRGASSSSFSKGEAAKAGSSLQVKQNYAKIFYDKGLFNTKELALLESKVELYLESKLFLKFVKLLFLGTTKMKVTLRSLNKAKFLLLDSLFFVPISCFNFLTESFENLLKSIYNFYKKPTELTLDWMAYIFLIEWSCDSITFIPENTESFFWTSFKKNGMNSIMSRNIWFGTLLDFFGFFSMSLDRIAFNSAMSEMKEKFPKIFGASSNNKLYYTAEVEKQTSGGISKIIESSLINFFVTSFLQRRLFFIFSHFIQTLNQPDSDLIVRQKKGTIYWDIWAEILMKAADKYNIIIPSLTNLKDEQTKLIDSLYLEQINQIDEVSKSQKLKEKISKIGKSHYMEESNSTIFMQNLVTRKTFYRPMNFNSSQGAEAIDRTFRSTDGKYKMNLSEDIGRSVNQFITYQGKDTDLFINLYPPKSFSHISSIKYYNQIHQPIATLICSIYSGIFYKQTAKNILVIGSSNTEKTLLIEAIAGETELKIITDNANRYTFVKSGVAVGIKLLRDVFDAISFHTPCLFLIEDIHVLGERRPLLISDDENSEVNKNGLSKDSESLEIHEKNQLMYQLSRHIITHYKKPYKGEFSLLIPTNHFSFDLFSFSRQGTLVENQIKNKTKQSPIENTTQGANGEPGSNTIPTLEGGQNQLSETSKNVYPTSLLLKSDKLLAPPATSPFTIFILKEQKKFKSKKLVKELPLNGLSTEQLALFPKHSYSIRIKVAILAEDALLNLSAKLDMITDLLVIIDNVRGNRGFVVFATTHIPSILDPALRRPGRLDETISIPKVQNLWSRWEILKTNLQNFFSAPSRIYPTLDFVQKVDKNNQYSFSTLSRSVDKESYYRSKIKPNIFNNQVRWNNLSTIDLIGSSKWNSNSMNFPMLAFYNSASYNKLHFATAKELGGFMVSEQSSDAIDLYGQQSNIGNKGPSPQNKVLRRQKKLSSQTEVWETDQADLCRVNMSGEKIAESNEAKLRVGGDDRTLYSDMKKHNLSVMSLWKTKIKAIIYFSIGKKLIIPKFYYTPQSWQTSQWGGPTNLDSKIKSQSLFVTNVNASTSYIHTNSEAISGSTLRATAESNQKSVRQLALLSSVSNKIELKRNETKNLIFVDADESVQKIKIRQNIKANLSKLLSNTGLFGKTSSLNTEISLDLSIDQFTLESQFATLYSNEGTLKGLLTRLFAGKICESFAFSNVCSEIFSFMVIKQKAPYSNYSENQKLHVKSDHFHHQNDENDKSSQSFTKPSLTDSSNSPFKKTRQSCKPIFNRFQMVYGIDESWKASTSLVFSLIKKRYLYRKNIIISSLLDFDNSTMNLGEPPSPPGSTILIPGKRYENYKRAMKAFENKSDISIGEKIQSHQQQRFIKRLYNLIVPSVSEKPNKISKKVFFSQKQDNQVENIDIAKRLGPIQEYCNKATSVNWYFRKKILNRHRHYLTNQWWNMQFPEHNPEAVFLSDVDWRYTFIDSIGELLIDFPDAEQIYNSNERRWMLTSGYWNSWFNFNNNEVSYKGAMKSESTRTESDIKNAAQSFDLSESVSPEAIMNHFIVESFTKAFNWLDKNRELLDYSSYKLQKKGFLKETTLINSFKRFQFFSLS